MIRKLSATPTAMGTKKLKSESRKHSSADRERDTQKGQVSALGEKHSERKFGLEMQQEAVRRGNCNQQHDSSVDFGGGGDKYVKTHKKGFESV